jgi:protein gp37
MTTARANPDFKFHPYAEIFPLMEGQEFDDLVADIKANGLLEWITTYQDNILDGRNRYRACVVAGIECRSVPYTGNDPVGWVISRNLKRRHLNESQRAMVAAKLATLRRGDNQYSEHPSIEGSSKLLNVGHASVERAKAVQKAGVPELIAAVEQGKVSVSAAADVASRAQDEQREIIARGEREILEQAKRIRGERAETRRAERIAKLDDEAVSPAANAPTIMLKTLGKEVPYKLSSGKPTFNKTNEQISWAAWSWNPVTGCLHNCQYCYAREIALRHRDAYPAGFTPLFHHERLDAPANTKVPDEAKNDPRLKRVFVCSMADLYGKWVPDEWIEKVHASCIANPQWDYLFLTKFPQGYVNLDLPPTAWIGTTVDKQYRVKIAEAAFRKIKGVRVKWLSLEPLLAPLEFTDLSMFDWIVIGAQSATNQPDGHVKEFAPPFKWVARLCAQAEECGCRVYLKPNLLGEPRPHSPGMQLLQEEPVIETAFADDLSNPTFMRREAAS